jgi:hypothetical protein
MRRKSERQALARSQYKVNVVLVVTMAFLLLLWFHLHVAVFWSRTLAVGTPLSIAFLWQALAPLVSRRSLSFQSLARRLLEKPNARGTLYMLLFMVSLLLLMTSSVHVVHEGGSGEHRVEVWKVGIDGQEDQLCIEPITVSSVNNIAGHLALFRIERLFAPPEVRVRVAKPFGYDDKRFTLYPWSRLYLPTPGEPPEGFARRRYRAVRLLPGKGLTNQPLFIPTREREGTYQVRIEVNGRHYDTYHNLMLECLYFGGNADILDSLIRSEAAEVRRHIIRSHLYGILGAHRDNLDDLTEILAGGGRKEPGNEIGAGASIQISVSTESPKPGYNPWKSSLYTLPQEGILTVFLERPEKGPGT